MAPTLDTEVLASLLGRLDDAVVVADAEGRIVLWNAAVVRVFGWSAGEAMGQSLDLIIPERLQDRHWTGFRRTMATGESDYAGRLLEVPAVHQDGHTISIAFTVTLAPAADGGVAFIAAVIRDETERRQERRALQARIDELSAPTGP